MSKTNRVNHGVQLAMREELINYTMETFIKCLSQRGFKITSKKCSGDSRTILFEHSCFKYRAVISSRPNIGITVFLENYRKPLDNTEHEVCSIREASKRGVEELVRRTFDKILEMEDNFKREIKNSGLGVVLELLERLEHTNWKFYSDFLNPEIVVEFGFFKIIFVWMDELVVKISAPPSVRINNVNVETLEYVFEVLKEINTLLSSLEIVDFF